MKTEATMWILVAIVCIGFTFEGSSGKDYPVYTSCDPKIVENIKNYWNTSGTPRDVKNTMEKTGRYVIYYTSYELDSNYKCVFLDVGDGAFNFTLTLKNGPPITYNYQVREEEEGVLCGKPSEADYAPEYEWKWYTIHLDEGLEVDYVCNDNHGEPKSPLGDIFVSTKSYHKLRDMRNSRKFKSLFETWGIKATFQSSKECFISDIFPKAL